MEISYVSIGILLNKKNEILLEKNQTNESFKGLWQFPGGKIENHETPICALKRELEEELSISIYEPEIEPFAFNDYSTENKHYVVLFFICRNWQGEINNNLSQDLQWVSLDQIESFPSLPYNKEIIIKLINSL